MNCPSPGPPQLSSSTRQLLLETAADVFALKGFRAATIREICRKAGANIAAVNYHFGDKEGLYREVLRHARDVADKVHPQYPESGPGTSPEAELRNFVRAFLARVFEEGRHALHGKLVSRELIEPTRAMDTLVEEEFRPMAAYLTRVVAALLGSAAEERLVRYCGISLVSQCLFYHHARSVLARLFPDMTFGSGDIEQLTEHITTSSLAAIRAYRQAGEERST